MTYIKKIIIEVFNALSLDTFFRFVSRQKIPMIGFHSVGNENDAWIKHLSFSEAEFEKRIAFVAKHYMTYTYSEIEECVNSRGSLPSRSACVYFDDGYEDNLIKALPILEKYNVKATVFIATSNVETKQALWPVHFKYIFLKMSPNAFVKFSTKHNLASDPLEAVRDLRTFSSKRLEILTKECVELMGKEEADLSIMLDKEQIKTLSENKLIEIGSHTVNHLNLNKHSDDVILNEFIQSKKELEAITGKKVASVSLPFGRGGENILNLAKRAGYKSVQTTKQGLNSKEEVETGLYRKIRTAPYESFSKWKYRLAGL